MERHNRRLRTGRAPSGGFALLVTLMVVGLSASCVQAEQFGDSVDVKFHGTLKKKPCLIDNDGDIYVHFGNVGVKRVDGQRYMQPVPYTIHCEETDPTWQLTLSVNGTQAGFENTALGTDATGLGIRILQNGVPMEINRAIPINVGSPPTLQAVPVQQSGVTLPEQAFTATATLLAEYQ